MTEPIAGTRPRCETPDADDRLETDLLDDEKERAEHAMLVDLERNDLGKVSKFGSVEVSDYRRVDRYSEVMHLVSVVEGRLRDGASLQDAIAAVFPGGTITGAPKPRTMEIIEEVESTRRGPYTGSIAAFGFDDRATLNIVIRTLVHHDDEYHLRVGAGIVHDSDPDREYRRRWTRAARSFTPSTRRWAGVATLPWRTSNDDHRGGDDSGNNTAGGPATDSLAPTVLVIDNYDSFAYNLVQYVGEVVLRLGGTEDDVVVRRNDAIAVEGIREMDPDGIVVSPGPGTPEDAGVSMPISRNWNTRR